jgi:endonuclease-3
MARESLENKKKRAAKIVKELQKLYPDMKCFLNHETPLQLLVAVMLSAQCTDERVNKVPQINIRSYIPGGNNPQKPQ